jgi:ABC-type nitrate/sulfonate/bicarbonate transport system ATPase subunit
MFYAYKKEEKTAIIVPHDITEAMFLKDRQIWSIKKSKDI